MANPLRSNRSTDGYTSTSAFLGANASASDAAGFAVRPSAGVGSASTISAIGSYGDEFALTSRRAARLNAATAEAELGKWMAERNLLLDAFFEDELTPLQKRRLTYVNWNIDRIEDARNGEILDVLEGFTLKYEQFRDDLASFKKQLESYSAKSDK